MTLDIGAIGASQIVIAARDAGLEENLRSLERFEPSDVGCGSFGLLFSNAAAK